MATSLTIYLFLTSFYFVMMNNVFGLEEPFFEKYSNSSSDQLIVQRVPSHVVRSQLYRQDFFLFAVNVGIGTSKTRKPYQTYLLHVDTSSPLSWVQCEGCKKCFRQVGKPYPKKNSSSFHTIGSSDKLCLTNRSDGKICSYEILYNKTSSTSGILATETLSLCTSNNNCKTFENLVIGCGLDQRKLVFGKLPANKIAGVLGLGRGPLSFLSQIDSVSNGKFSYCLPRNLKNQVSGKCNTYLRFGADALPPPHKQKQMMTTKLHGIAGRPFYYVELDGISFDKRRLEIDPSVFRFEGGGGGGGGGGVIVNSGVRLGQLAKPAYDVLIKELDSHFLKLNYKKGSCMDHPENFKPRVSYRKKVKNHVIPTVTFHFKGSADLVLKNDALFTSFVLQTELCLGIYPDDKLTVIGAQQQTGHWFMFDTKSNQLLFREENCN